MAESAYKKMKLPSLADAGASLGAADAFLEALPGAKSSTSSSSEELAFGSCHLPPRLLAETFPSSGLRPAAAAQLLRDFRALDSRPSLNVASFVTTQVEPECRELMAEALTVNFIDEEEYPSTAQIQQQCVAQLGDLLFAERDGGDDGGGGGPGKHCGTSTVGSSEAILLSYLAMKRRWQEKRRAAGLPLVGVQCSVVVPSSYHVCHEKAANYFEIEMRVAPLKKDRYWSVAEDLLPLVDETTIGCVCILGSTYTGHFDDVAGISAALEAHNAKNPGHDVGLHVDGASGGFIAATLFPHLRADFRSAAVVSMNLSGHKTGQVCAGVGWAMFRSRKYLPESLVFHGTRENGRFSFFFLFFFSLPLRLLADLFLRSLSLSIFFLLLSLSSDSYLGNDQISFTLNFSKGASQILGQA